MTLLFPLGLAALASALLPLLIHLARRTEARPTDFAALRWLRQKPRPRHRPRFDERLLLAVRLLLLVAIALVLAQPTRSPDDAAEAVIAVAPGAAIPPEAAARRIWLSPGFPAIDRAPSALAPPAPPLPAPPLPVASLIRQLDAELPAGARLTIVVPRILDGADAEPPTLSRAVTWRIADEGRAPAPATPAPKPPPPPELRYDPASPGTRYIAAAVRALGGTDIGGLDQPLAHGRGGGAALVWIARGPLPAAVAAYARAGHTILVSRDAIVPAAPAVVVWRDGDGLPLVEAQPSGRGRILRFTRPLTPAAMPDVLEPRFPRRLAALLTLAPEPARVAAAAYAPRQGGRPPMPPVQPLWPWLAVAVAALFLIERWLATRAGRAVAA